MFHPHKSRFVLCSKAVTWFSHFEKKFDSHKSRRNFHQFASHTMLSACEGEPVTNKGTNGLPISACHSDILWRHSMETFSVLLGLCEGNHRSPVDSPHKRPVFFYVSLNERLNKQSTAGDLRRHDGHCDVIVMNLFNGCISNTVDLLCNYNAVPGTLIP